MSEFFATCPNMKNHRQNHLRSHYTNSAMQVGTPTGSIEISRLDLFEELVRTCGQAGIWESAGRLIISHRSNGGFIQSPHARCKLFLKDADVAVGGLCIHLDGGRPFELLSAGLLFSIKRESRFHFPKSDFYRHNDVG